MKTEQLTLELVPKPAPAPAVGNLPPAQDFDKRQWGEIIYYLDGWAWGIDANGTTVCLGRETAVKAAIANPKQVSGDPVIDAIIDLERQLLGPAERTRSREREKAKR